MKYRNKIGAIPALRLCIALIAFVALMWTMGAPDAEAYSDFGANGTTNNCQMCHSGVFGAGNTAAHTAHAASVGGNCATCHGGFPAALSSCTQCHVGAGLRQHHRNAGAHTCSGCHANPENGGTENTTPPGYAGTALN
ncbi:MAG: cytochrome c3 family protein, partial [Nitrospirota bacterium]